MELALCTFVLISWACLSFLAVGCYRLGAEISAHVVYSRRVRIADRAIAAFREHGA